MGTCGSSRATLAKGVVAPSTDGVIYAHHCCGVPARSNGRGNATRAKCNNFW